MATEFTINRIRAALARYVDTDSLTICNLIHSITETDDEKKCPTMGITKAGHLIFNRAWVDKNIHSDRDIAAVCLHEIFHPLMSLFYAPFDEIAHIAMDATINALIYQIYGSKVSDFFTQTYKGTYQVNCVLHGGNEARRTRFNRLHANLYALWSTTNSSRIMRRRYGGNANATKKITAPEVLTALNILLDREMIPVTLVLIGSHDDNFGEGFDVDGADVTRLNSAQQKFIKDLLDSAKAAGFDENLTEMLIQMLESTKSPKLKLFEDYAVKHTMGKFLTDETNKRVKISTVPIRPSRKDLVMLASGVPIVYFHNDVWSIEKKPDKTVHVYLDVSGSIWGNLPNLLGVLDRFKEYLDKIYQFSNKVVEVSIDDIIKKGRILSTHGTDFDCIAANVLAEKQEKAIIITDGYARMTDQHLTQLHEAKVKFLTVYEKINQSNDQLAELGDHILVEDLLED